VRSYMKSDRSEPGGEMPVGHAVTAADDMEQTHIVTNRARADGNNQLRTLQQQGADGPRNVHLYCLHFKHLPVRDRQVKPASRSR